MKKIIPFKKDIIFKTNIAEITSISLENTLSLSEDNAVNGNFTVSGEYKMADESIHTESFSYDLPFDIHMDEKYDMTNSLIEVDDFYYEIINNNILSVNIDVLIDKLEEKLLPEIEKLEEITIPREDILEEDRIFTLDETKNTETQPRCIEPEEIKPQTEIIKPAEEPKYEKVQTIEESTSLSERIQISSEVKPQTERIQVPEEISSLFDNIDQSSETYKSYKVYIVREGDDLEFIMEKYSTSKEIIEQYNDLTNLKIGDKIIIPALNDSI